MDGRGEKSRIHWDISTFDPSPRNRKTKPSSAAGSPNSGAIPGIPR
jgi:hypothetical protein